MPEDVITKVEPRLVKFKLREILKIYQTDKIKFRQGQYVIKGVGKSK